MSCTHTKGWKFLPCSAGDRLPGVWVCNEGCGKTSNENPEKPYPKGIRYTETNQGYKDLPPLVSDDLKKVRKHD